MGATRSCSLGTYEGVGFLEQVSRHAERNGISCVYWIDGNHENHDLLAKVLPDADGVVRWGVTLEDNSG